MMPLLKPELCELYGVPLPPAYKIDRAIWVPHDTPTPVYIKAKRGHFKQIIVRDDAPGKWIDQHYSDTPGYCVTVYIRHQRPCYLAVSHGYEFPEFTMFRHHAYRNKVSAPSRQRVVAQ